MRKSDICKAQRHLCTALLKLTFQTSTHKGFMKIAGEPTVSIILLISLARFGGILVHCAFKE
jgi:hypothetical protein